MSFKQYTAAENAILTTLLYSDIFSFPLRKAELWRFLIAPEKISRKEFERSLETLAKQFTLKEKYICLNGKGKFIQERIQNLIEVEQKMQRAQWITNKLSAIPSILFIGVSGGLAAGNVTKDDDIDLVIIVKKNTLFLSRLLILLVLEILGVRRLRNQKHAADTICVNLLFDETALGWFARNKDIYTAREIGQMIPLFQRKETYQTFLSANIWIQDFLPNIHASSPSKPRAIQGQGRDTGRAITLFRILFFNPFFEFLSQQVQLSFMKRHRTNEIIENNLLAFHPNDYRIKTLRLLRLKMRQFGLLTKI